MDQANNQEDSRTNRQTPFWVAGVAEYEKERAFVGRNWLQGPQAVMQAQIACFGSVVAGLASVAAKACDASPALVNALGHAQTWVWTGSAAFVLFKCAKICVLEAKHRRALSRAVDAIDPQAGSRESLMRAANDMEQDDFARLVAIKALRREAKNSLDGVGELSRKDVAAYRETLKNADREIDKRLDRQAEEAWTAKLSSPFSTEATQREVKAVALRPRRIGA